jgi:hypothetical protein
MMISKVKVRERATKLVHGARRSVATSNRWTRAKVFDHQRAGRRFTPAGCPA